MSEQRPPYEGTPRRVITTRASDIAPWRSTATRWGPWRYRRDNLTLEYAPEDGYAPGEYAYYVDLEECRTSAEVLDWIAQISHKTWVSSESIGHLVEALDDLLAFQSNLCSSGSERALRGQSIEDVIGRDGRPTR